MSSQGDPMKNDLRKNDLLYGLLLLAAGWVMAYALDKYQSPQEDVQAPMSVPEWMVQEARDNGAL